MHSPLEIARNYIEVGIHKVNLSIFKTILLGFFAGMFIGFAGIASTTASSTIGIASVAKLVGAAVFPAGMAMVLVAGSELFTGTFFQNVLYYLYICADAAPLTVCAVLSEEF